MRTQHVDSSGLRMPSPVLDSHVEREAAYSVCIEQLREALQQQIPSVVSFWVHGSRGRGQNRDGSDLDLTIVYSDSAEAVRAACIKTLGEPIVVFDYYGESTCELWSFQGFEVGIRLANATDLTRLVDEVYESTSSTELHQDTIRHVVLSARPLIDDGGFCQMVKERVRVMPDSIRMELFDTYLGRAVQKLAWLDSRSLERSPFAEQYRVYNLVDELGRAHYASNGLLYMRGRKWMHEDLVSMSPNLQSEFLRLTQNSKTDLERLELSRTLHEIAERIFESFKTRCPDWRPPERVIAYFDRTGVAQHEN